MPSDKAARTLLVVEDDPTIRKLLSVVLKREGYAVVLASNGREALERLMDGFPHDRLPHAILLDMCMPILDGWGFAREIRAHGLRVPILVMTDEHDAAGCATEIGADGYLAKPFKVADLIDSLANLTQLASLPARIRASRSV